MYLSNRYYQLQFSHNSVYLTMFYVSRCVIFDRYFMSLLLDISIVNKMRFQNTYIVCKCLCTTESLWKTLVFAWNAARSTGRALDHVMTWCWPRAKPNPQPIFTGKLMLDSKLQLHFNRNVNCSLENAFENVVCWMPMILFKPPCVRRYYNTFYMLIVCISINRALGSNQASK